MRKLIWSLGILMCLFSGCLKPKDTDKCNFPDSSLVAPANETGDVQSYLTTNSISASQHSSGFFYKVNNQGTGPAIVNLCSNLLVKYTGKLVNGSVFDSTGTGTATFQLGQLIPAWQKGLPLISKGGKITLYVPPTLGYGNRDVRNNAGVIIIPANSTLIFDIELVDIG
ncbi:MAG: FKBP-type peptidyl-prolyl cis-trans isomerase [Ginsengibacter sp.]